MKTKAQGITNLDWNDIALLPAVQEAFETKYLHGSHLAETVYGAKFVLSTFEESSQEVIVYTLVKRVSKKEITVILERHNEVYSVIKNGKAKVQKPKY